MISAFVFDIHNKVNNILFKSYSNNAYHLYMYVYVYIYL
jgi:hypothetical protein